MEVERNRNGSITAGLTTGIIGTALGVLNGGLFGMGGCGCSSNGVTQYELSLEASNAAKDSEIALLKANTYNDQKLLEVYKYFDGELKEIRNQMCNQSVINAQFGTTIGCMQQNLATLNGLTKTVIPASSICPEVMPRYNSWVAPTTDAGGTT